MSKFSALFDAHVMPELEKQLGVPVLYRRGTSQAIAVHAVPVAQGIELMDATRAKIQGQRSDWIVNASDIIFGGVQSEPQEGDQIEVLDEDHKTRTYEAAPVNSKECFEHVLGSRAAYVIHTNLISES
jgi:hypothetical protein